MLEAVAQEFITILQLSQQVLVRLVVAMLAVLLLAIAMD
jgi:hypothetical protein